MCKYLLNLIKFNSDDTTTAWGMTMTAKMKLSIISLPYTKRNKKESKSFILIFL